MRHQKKIARINLVWKQNMPGLWKDVKLATEPWKEQDSLLADIHNRLQEMEKKNISGLEEKTRKGIWRNFGSRSCQFAKYACKNHKGWNRSQKKYSRILQRHWRPVKSQIDLLPQAAWRSEKWTWRKMLSFNQALSAQGLLPKQNFWQLSAKISFEVLRVKEQKLQNPARNEIQWAIKGKIFAAWSWKGREFDSADAGRILRKSRRKIRRKNEGTLRIVASWPRNWKQNEEAKALRGQKMILLGQMKNDYENYKALDDLIGSANGNRFRQFAQGLTFEILIAHANRQLEKNEWPLSFWLWIKKLAPGVECGG